MNQPNPSSIPGFACSRVDIRKADLVRFPLFSCARSIEIEMGTLGHPECNRRPPPSPGTSFSWQIRLFKHPLTVQLVILPIRVMFAFSTVTKAAFMHILGVRLGPKLTLEIPDKNNWSIEKLNDRLSVAIAACS
jgi:hypothetical protein